MRATRPSPASPQSRLGCCPCKRPPSPTANSLACGGATQLSTPICDRLHRPARPATTTALRLAPGAARASFLEAGIGRDSAANMRFASSARAQDRTVCACACARARVCVCVCVGGGSDQPRRAAARTLRAPSRRRSDAVATVTRARAVGRLGQAVTQKRRWRGLPRPSALPQVTQ